MLFELIRFKFVVDIIVNMNIINIDILAVNESKLDSIINDHEFFVPGYEIVWRDRQINGRKGGGVCFYLRRNLNFKVCEELKIDRFECLTVEISKLYSRPFLVSTWYKRPNSPPNLSVL